MRFIGNCGDLLTATLQLKNYLHIQDHSAMPVVKKVEDFSGMVINEFSHGALAGEAYEVYIESTRIGTAYKVDVQGRVEYVTAVDS